MSKSSITIVIVCYHSQYFKEKKVPIMLSQHDVVKVYSYGIGYIAGKDCGHLQYTISLSQGEQVTLQLAEKFTKHGRYSPADFRNEALGCRWVVQLISSSLMYQLVSRSL